MSFDPESHAAHFLEGEGPVLGLIGGAGRTPGVYPEHDRQETQACQHNPGHVLLPDPPVSTTGFQLMGVQPGPALDSMRALRHDA